jgi:hypothetical protein
MARRRKVAQPHEGAQLPYQALRDDAAQSRDFVADLRARLESLEGARPEDARRIARTALDAVEEYADVLERVADLLDDRQEMKEMVEEFLSTHLRLSRWAKDARSLVMSEHGRDSMARINSLKLLRQEELDNVRRLYRELEPQYPKQAALQKAIAQQLGMRDRRVRSAVEKLRKQGKL